MSDKVNQLKQERDFHHHILLAHSRRSLLSVDMTAPGSYLLLFVSER